MTTTLPLHLALAYLLVKLHPLNADQEPVYPYSSTFTSAVLHIVAREVLEISDPATFRSLTSEIDALVKVECAALRKRNDRLRNRGQVVPAIQEDAEEYESWMEVFALEFQDPASGCSFIDHLEREIRDRISERTDEDMADTQEPFEHRSPLGVFLRRLLLSLRKLSFEDTTHVSRQIAEWCGIDLRTRTVHRKIGADDLDRQNALDDALATGDYSRAISSLRRFYDHKFPSSKSQHSHGLLNLAGFLFQTGGTESARTAVEEAIRIARKDGDKSCLQSCMSLLHQISASDEPGQSSSGARRAILAQFPPASTPNDELGALLTALDLGEPLPLALQRVHLALARHLGSQSAQLDESASHLIQARIWDEMGGCELAQVHEDLALGLEHGSDQRLDVGLSRASRSAARGDYDTALQSLLSKDFLDGLSFAEYARWADVVWEILHNQADVRGDDQALSLLDSLQSRHIPLQSATNQMRNDLRKSLKLLHASTPAHIVLPDILRTVHQARGSGAWRIYRYAVVILAEALLGLDKGMGGKVAQMIEGIWDGVMRSGDEDVKTMAALVLGKAEVELGTGTEYDSPMLERGIQHLKDALVSAKQIRHRQFATEAASLLALLADLTDAPDRDRFADEWHNLQTVEVGLRGQIQQVGEVIKLVGVRVAQGWV